ncbi:MAG: RluA family pseudouridine synthase, partial [Phycisphaeraceae bacterium]|nr:RluA family pseudouridine synthase [Phycisphaeraceae bacterium]
GDVIDVQLPPPAVRSILPEPIPIDVLYEDDDFIVINKQAGLIVHPARSNLSGTLVNGLAYRFQQQHEAAGLPTQIRLTSGFRSTDPAQPHDVPPEQVEGIVRGLSRVGAAEYRPGIIHRLDKNTTGVLVVGKDEQAHWGIAKQFEKRQTRKAYLAVVHGNPDEPAMVIDLPIGKHPTVHEAFCVRHDHLGKPSLSIARVREQYQGFALVEIELRTGRTHQIRVHMSYQGYPIVGDVMYGGEPVGEAEIATPPHVAGSRRFLNYAREKAEGQKMDAEADARADMIQPGPALHAALLGFTHPRTREPMTFTAPVHEPMATLIRKLRQRKIDAPCADGGCSIDLDRAIADAGTES